MARGEGRSCERLLASLEDCRRKHRHIADVSSMSNDAHQTHTQHACASDPEHALVTAAA